MLVREACWPPVGETTYNNEAGGPATAANNSITIDHTSIEIKETDS